MDGIDLFGKIPQTAKQLSRVSKRRLAESRQAAAFAEIPKVIHALGHARDAGAPYERAFWSAHRELEDACARKPELTRAQLFGFYDRRMEAGHAWYPFRCAVQSAEDWLSALQREIKECDAELGI